MKKLVLSMAMLTVLSAATPSAEDDAKTFVDHFYDNANIPSYVALVDNLIDAGEAKVYGSIDEEKKDPQTPREKSSNGILMLYTVAHTPDGVLVHFSTSRAPYLPMPLGRHIVGLFMARSGWPKPAVFQVSENQVFHAIWMVPESQFAQIQPALAGLHAKIRSSEDAKEAFLRGLLRSRDLDEKPSQSAQPTLSGRD